MRNTLIQDRNYTPPQRPSLTNPNNSWLKRKVLAIWYAVLGVLSRPAYAVPLLLNVTGSIWFFILIGKAELSLTVPITNSLAFLFTVLGEWWAEKKVISRGQSCAAEIGARRLTYSRYLDRHGICARGHWAMCAEQDLGKPWNAISTSTAITSPLQADCLCRHRSLFSAADTDWRSPFQVVAANSVHRTSDRPR